MGLLLARAIKIIVSQKAKFWCFNSNIVSGFQLSILDFDKNQPDFQKTKLKFVNANTGIRNLLYACFCATQRITASSTLKIFL